MCRPIVPMEWILVVVWLLVVLVVVFLSHWCHVGVVVVVVSEEWS